MSRLVVLTGCTSGLGYAMVNKLVSKGCQVVGCGRKQAKIDELRARFPGQFYGMKVDISKDYEVEAWAQKAIKDHGCPSLLLNNAGIINTPKSLIETEPDEFDQLLRINVGGYFYTIRHFAPTMILQQIPTVIVNISSGWGQIGGSKFGPYCSSKFAVEGLTKSLALELPKPHAVVSVNPGIIGTEMGFTAHGNEVGARSVTAAEWAEEGIDQILKFNRTNNGQTIKSPISDLSISRAFNLG